MDALPIPDAARLCGVAPKEIRERIDQGILRAVVRAGRRHVPVRELVRAGLMAEPESEVAGKEPPEETTQLESLRRELSDLRQRVERLEADQAPGSMREALTPLFEGAGRAGKDRPEPRRPPR